MDALGADYLEARDKSTNSFNGPLRNFQKQQLLHGMESSGLEKKFRSMLCLAMLTALNRPHELSSFTVQSTMVALSRKSGNFTAHGAILWIPLR